MNADEYQCANCDGIFQRGWPEEAALADREANGFSGMECVVVCDDCYRKIMQWARATGLHESLD